MKSIITLACIVVTLVVMVWFFGILRLGEQSLCEPNEIIACCSLYEDDVCYISGGDICLTEYNIKCVPRNNNYPVLKTKPFSASASTN